MCKAKYLICAGLVLAAPGTAGAGTYNPRGNSLELTWTEERQIIDGRGRERSIPLQVYLQLYISSQGRFFTKFEGHNGMGGLRNNAAVSAQNSNSGLWAWQLRGNQLTGTGKMGSGARRVQVLFRDDGSCTVAASAGKRQGADDIMARSMMSGRRVHILSVHAVDLRCTAHTGNVFAQ